MGKGLYEKKFDEWFATQLRDELESGKEYYGHVSFTNNENFACRVVNRLLQSVNFVTQKKKLF